MSPFDVLRPAAEASAAKYEQRRAAMLPILRLVQERFDCITLEGSTRGFHDAVNALEKRAVLPAKEDTYGNIEGLMHHFKLIMVGHGIRPPKGEYYSAVEGANGELGFYVVSDGSDRPYRVRVRPPCFTIMAALPELLNGDMVADIVPTFGSVNMIGGELDR